MKRLTGGKGVDVVYDSVGKDTFDKGLDCLRPRGNGALRRSRAGRCRRSIRSPERQGLALPDAAEPRHYIATREELSSGRATSSAGSRRAS